MLIRFMSKRARRQRLHQLIDELATHEVFMRETCAQIVELTEPGDAIDVQVRELLEYLES